MPAAINGKVDSSNEAGSVRCQESDAVGHFLHLARPSKGVGLLTPCKKLAVEKIYRMSIECTFGVIMGSVSCSRTLVHRHQGE